LHHLGLFVLFVHYSLIPGIFLADFFLVFFKLLEFFILGMLLRF